MATMNVSLPEELRVCIDALVRSGEYQTNSDYVRELVRADLERRTALADLAAAVRAGLDGKGVPYSREMWRGFSERVLQAIEKPNR